MKRRNRLEQIVIAAMWASFAAAVLMMVACAVFLRSEALFWYWG